MCHGPVYLKGRSYCGIKDCKFWLNISISFLPHFLEKKATNSLHNSFEIATIATTLNECKNRKTNAIKNKKELLFRFFSPLSMVSSVIALYNSNFR